jgi:hypothetical protein
MNIKAILVQKLQLQTGQSQNGQWKKQDIIVETEGQYRKKICISIWGDKINEDQLKIGNILKIDCDIESREYNGKWYTDIKAWKIEVANTGNFDAVNDERQSNEPSPQIDNDILPF